MEFVLYSLPTANIDVPIANRTERRFLPITGAGDIPKSFELDFSECGRTSEIDIGSGGSGAFSLFRLTVDDLVPIPLPAGLPPFACAQAGKRQGRAQEIVP